MSDFINDYFNIKRMIKEKQKYKQLMRRVEKLPKDYQFVFKKIQSHMWMFTSGTGYDMMDTHSDLIDLFELSAFNGKKILEVTGDDVAAFCEELLKNTKTYTEDRRKKLNHQIIKKIKNAE